MSLAGLGCAGEANHSDKASTVSVELSPCSPHPDKSMRGYMDESKGPLDTLCSPNSVNRRIVTSLLSEAPAIGQPSGEGGSGLPDSRVLYASGRLWAEKQALSSVCSYQQVYRPGKGRGSLSQLVSTPMGVCHLQC